MENQADVCRTHSILRYREGLADRTTREFVREEPLLIRVEDRTYSVVMRTPGDEIAHAAGFCLSEGLVASPEDIAAIGFCRDLDENSVSVALARERKAQVLGQLERGGFLSQTSCGICGREMVDDLLAFLTTIGHDEFCLTERQIQLCVDRFSREQKYYQRTRGTHAVMLFDAELEIIAKAEDVGRHNAMDKSVGALFLQHRLPDVRAAVLSSRISFEMIQKAARAAIPLLISMSNPTSMAVDLGSSLNMTLICLDKPSGFVVSCGDHRVRAESSGSPE